MSGYKLLQWLYELVDGVEAWTVQYERCLKGRHKNIENPLHQFNNLATCPAAKWHFENIEIAYTLQSVFNNPAEQPQNESQFLASTWQVVSLRDCCGQSRESVLHRLVQHFPSCDNSQLSSPYACMPCKLHVRTDSSCRHLQRAFESFIGQMRMICLPNFQAMCIHLLMVCLLGDEPLKSRQEEKALKNTLCRRWYLKQVRRSSTLHSDRRIRQASTLQYGKQRGTHLRTASRQTWMPLRVSSFAGILSISCRPPRPLEPKLRISSCTIRPVCLQRYDHLKPHLEFECDLWHLYFEAEPRL